MALKVLDGVKVYNGYLETNPAIKERYNITKVPTLILYRDGEGDRAGGKQDLI